MAEQTNGEKKNFYALIIGVDQFAGNVPALAGCVNDAKKWASYLKANVNREEYNTHFLELYSDKATSDAGRNDANAGKTANESEALKKLPSRANILNGIKTHLGKAGKGDIAFLFFAGHGSTEAAHPYFWAESKQLETLVCWDSRFQAAGATKKTRDIIDKELRFLIYKLSKGQLGENKEKGCPEVIMVQDSCHSGGATRSVVNNTDQSTKDKLGLNKRLYTPKGEDVMDARDETDYEPEFQSRLMNNISKEDYREEKTKNAPKKGAPKKPFHEAFPLGNHVHFAACSSQECAYEIRGGGVFTDTMISLLEKTRGNISYEALEKRARLMISSAYKQQPNLTIISDDSNKRFSKFLGGVAESDNSHYVVTVHNKSWMIDVGGVHGLLVVNPNNAKQKIPIKVFDDANQKTYPAAIYYVRADRSFIEFTGETPPEDPTNIYFAIIPPTFEYEDEKGKRIQQSFKRLKPRVFIDTESIGNGIKNPVLDIDAAYPKHRADFDKAAFTKQVETPEEADYLIRAKGDHIYLVHQVTGTEIAIRLRAPRDNYFDMKLSGSFGKEVPSSAQSPETKQASERKKLKEEASKLADYQSDFPPLTFTERAIKTTIEWLSRQNRALKETQLSNLTLHYDKYKELVGTCPDYENYVAFRKLAGKHKKEGVLTYHIEPLVHGTKTILDILNSEDGKAYKVSSLTHTEDETKAAFIVKAYNGFYHIHQKKSGKEIPLTSSIGYSEVSAHNILESFGKITNYRSARNLQNPASKLSDVFANNNVPFELSVKRKNQEILPVDLDADGNPPQKDENGKLVKKVTPTYKAAYAMEEFGINEAGKVDRALATTLAITFKNKPDNGFGLYIGALLFDESFGIKNLLASPIDGSIEIKGEKPLGVDDGKICFLKDNAIIASNNNFATATYYLKLYVAGSLLDLSSVTQEALPPPTNLIPSVRGGHVDGDLSGKRLNTKEKPKFGDSLADWKTWGYRISLDMLERDTSGDFEEEENEYVE